MTPSIAILSPHQDDAVFSLALCVRRLVDGGVPVHVVNCFTRSEHAPYRVAHDARPVSAVRAAEDRAALRQLGVERVTDLGRLDAPLRRALSVADVCADRPFDADDEAEAARIAAALEPLIAHDLLLAPLVATGGHVDHRVARHAALLLGTRRLGFYEDLPYAARCNTTHLIDAARDLASELGESLVPLAVISDDGGRAKHALAMTYASQVTAADVDLLDCSGAARGYAERLWLTASVASSLASLLASRFG